MKIENKTFLDQEIDITNCDIEDCTFDGCIVVLNTPSVVQTFYGNVDFTDCLLTGEGWGAFLNQLGVRL